MGGRWIGRRVYPCEVRLTMLGTRGVPASYSGFETCVEQVGKRLAARGHRVLVYCRAGQPGAAGDHYLGMERVVLPAIKTKGLETLTHSALSTAHALTRDHPDAVVIFGVGNAVFARAFRLAHIPVAINVDGADWARRKWGGLGRRYLRWSEGAAARLASAVIADSHTVAAYYEQEYRRQSIYIPYGAEVPSAVGTATLQSFGLKPRGYFLAVGRFVPENGLHHLIAAYARVSPPIPFVIVGDAPYSEDYKRQLRKIAPPNVIFTGYQFGAAYQELSANAFAFLFGAEVGGTHPVLVEQLAYGNCAIARWTASNAEVAADSAIMYHDPETELPGAIESLLRDPELVNRMRERARNRAQAYSWDRITDEYERLLAGLTGSTVRGATSGVA
jgi:glycosyltransferase involved in cell wall biosynthesis